MRQQLVELWWYIKVILFFRFATKKPFKSTNTTASYGILVSQIIPMDFAIVLLDYLLVNFQMQIQYLLQWMLSCSLLC